MSFLPEKVVNWKQNFDGECSSSIDEEFLNTLNSIFRVFIHFFTSSITTIFKSNCVIKVQIPPS